uniref:16S rRNA (adenine(1518)-N(6)/adenine(1519)-N(6))- dimethyltransferase RsmA n=1 Tax=Eubacterium sp. TaxID=142586 RepID=UPI00402979BD
MNLCSYNEISSLLKRHGFTFSKALGQNFIINERICPAMAQSLNANENTGVLEIGPGIGVLTKELCSVAGKVVSVELDNRLFPILSETLSDCGNIEIVEGDALKMDLNALIDEKFTGMSDIKVCANLPYYITSPIIMKLIESKLPVSEIVVMVQKEVADRLAAQIGSRESGALTVAAQYYAEIEKLFDVSRGSFMPQPKVDSAVIKLSVRKEPPVRAENEKRFFEIVRAAFAQRRKTALNSLSSSLNIPKDKVRAALEKIGRNENDRAERFSMDEFAALSALI